MKYVMTSVSVIYFRIFQGNMARDSLDHTQCANNYFVSLYFFLSPSC